MLQDFPTNQCRVYDFEEEARDLLSGITLLVSFSAATFNLMMPMSFCHACVLCTTLLSCNVKPLL